MLCKKPFYKKGAAFGCGQCLPCRINKRRLWTHRIVLEALVSADASFVTLTYEKEPDGRTLFPRDLQLWLKRYRQVRGNLRTRFFAVGEYGDKSQRPHYHVALFGEGVSDGDVVRETWCAKLSDPHPLNAINGFTHTGTLTFESAQYIAGYTTKKMVKEDDERLNGRHPEFARMSLRPGIGAPATVDIAAGLGTSCGLAELEASGDVPAVLRHGSRLLPLGRYLRQRLRDEIGLIKPDNSNAAFEKSRKMQAMYEAYKRSKKNKPFAVHKEEQKAQKILNVETLYKIHDKKGEL